jgi:hypothetical protein
MVLIFYVAHSSTCSGKYNNILLTDLRALFSTNAETSPNAVRIGVQQTEDVFIISELPSSFHIYVTLDIQQLFAKT